MAITSSRVRDILANHLVIHCPEEWMAKELCRAMDDYGLTWLSGRSYMNETRWDICEDKTCYNPVCKTFGDINKYKQLGSEIVEFIQLAEKTKKKTGRVKSLKIF